MKPHSQKSPSKRLILILSLMVVLLIAGAIYYFAFGVIKASFFLPMDILVSYKLGMNGDTDGLHFGVIQPGGGSKKSITLTNMEDYPLQIIMTPSGNITPYLLIPDNYFYLNASQRLVLDFWIQTPKNISYGNYTGELRILMKK